MSTINEKDLSTTEHMVDNTSWEVIPAMETFKNNFRTPVCPNWISRDGKTITYVIRDTIKADHLLSLAQRLIRTLNLPLDAALCFWNKVIDLEITYHDKHQTIN